MGSRVEKEIFYKEVDNYIALTQLLTDWVVNRTKDSFQWRLEALGQFPTKSTFLKLTIGATKVNLPLVNLIWKPKIPRKTKFFLWSLPYRSLNTQDKLQRKFPNCNLSPSMCPLCQKEAETLDHIFLLCEFASKGWNRIFYIFGLDGCLPLQIDDWMMEGLNRGSFCEKGRI